MGFYIGGTQVIDDSNIHYSARSGTDAGSTGFITQGGDIGQLVRYTTYTDDNTNNCAGVLPTGNCLGNAKYVPPNGNWWTWGVSGISTGLCGNPSGFDFAGGRASAYYPINQLVYIYDAYYLLYDRIRGLEYHRNYYCCNCNGYGSAYYTVGNCYNNCNCNCACDCNCSTDGTGTGCCFLKGSLIRMADGTDKPIEDVKVGDKVIGAHGEVNEVLALNRPKLGNRLMGVINGEHSTSLDHAHVRPDNTFGSVSLHEYLTDENNTLHEVIVDDKGTREVWLLPGFYDKDLDMISDIQVGEQLLTVDGPKDVITVEKVEMPPETQLYNLVMGGSHTYFVEGYCVTGFLNGKDFDYRTWTSSGPAWTPNDYKNRRA
jgi:hypothetical protein